MQMCAKEVGHCIYKCFSYSRKPLSLCKPIKVIINSKSSNQLIFLSESDKNIYQNTYEMYFDINVN
jgi:hypothetical protein